jgi:hypothetical protein
MMYQNQYQYQDHLKTCGYCRNQKEKDHKAKLAELGHMIRGTKGASSSGVTTTGSYLNDQVGKAKLRELGKMIKGQQIK